MLPVFERRRAAGLALGGILAAGLVVGRLSAQDTPARTASASAVKAAYLLNFTRYVDWPRAAFPDSSSAIVVCVVGADPFGPVLDDVVRNRQVQGRPIEVRRLPSPQPTDSCHVAFLSGGPPALRRAREVWRERPVLLVGDGPTFAAKGGTIGFVEADRTIRFQINADAARAHGIQISSRVMALATQVYGAREGP